MSKYQAHALIRCFSWHSLSLYVYGVRKYVNRRQSITYKWWPSIESFVTVLHMFTTLNDCWIIHGNQWANFGNRLMEAIRKTMALAGVLIIIIPVVKRVRSYIFNSAPASLEVVSISCRPKRIRGPPLLINNVECCRLHLRLTGDDRETL